MAKEEKQKKQTFLTKVYECCGADDLRPEFQNIFFMGGYAYASNGTVCIKQTLEFQGLLNIGALEGKALHRDSYKDIMGFEMAEASETGIECWNQNGQKAFYEYTLIGPDRRPHFENFLKATGGEKMLGSIGVIPDSISRISKAMYSPTGVLKLTFTGIDRNIIVEVADVPGQVATMMPGFIQEGLFG